jgi:hypothetical protein
MMPVAGLESTYSANFAAFLSAASKADAHWYSVKRLSEGISSLPYLFGTSEQWLNEVLVMMGFGKLVNGDSFRFWPDKFNNFLVTSGIGDCCEHTHFRTGGFSRSQHFIRVGAANLSIMSKPGAIAGPGPRIRNLTDLLTTFNKSIAAKTTPVNGGGASQDHSQSLASTTAAESVPDPTMTELTLLRMKSLLLPLLLKPELVDSDSIWQPGTETWRTLYAI